MMKALEVTPADHGWYRMVVWEVDGEEVVSDLATCEATDLLSLSRHFVEAYGDDCDIVAVRVRGEVIVPEFLSVWEAAEASV